MPGSISKAIPLQQDTWWGAAYPAAQELVLLPNGCWGTSAQQGPDPARPSEYTDACQPTLGTHAGASAGSAGWIAAPGSAEEYWLEPAAAAW